MKYFVLYQTNIARVRNCPGITILVSNEVCNGVVDGVGVTKSHTYISFYNLCDSPKICWLLSLFPSTAFKLGFDQGGRDGWVGGVGSFINFSQCSFLKFLFFLSLTKSLVALDSLVAVWIVIQEKTAPVCPVPFQMRFPAPFKEFFLSFSSFTSDFALEEFETVFIFMGGPESEPSLQLSHINCIAMCENDFCNV